VIKGGSRRPPASSVAGLKPPGPTPRPADGVPLGGVGAEDRQRARGDSLCAIADSLNRDDVPTAQGCAQWYPATVRQILLRTS
jgi:hypothetical protein